MGKIISKRLSDLEMSNIMLIFGFPFTFLSTACSGAALKSSFFVITDGDKPSF